MGIELLIPLLSGGVFSVLRAKEAGVKTICI